MKAHRQKTPHDRATRLLDVAIQAVDADSECREDDRVMLFLDGVDNRSALVMHGYESDADAIAHLFSHLAAIFEANGKRLAIIPFGEEGQG